MERASIHWKWSPKEWEGDWKVGNGSLRIGKVIGPLRIGKGIETVGNGPLRIEKDIKTLWMVLWVLETELKRWEWPPNHWKEDWSSKHWKGDWNAGNGSLSIGKGIEPLKIWKGIETVGNGPLRIGKGIETLGEMVLLGLERGLKQLEIGGRIQTTALARILQEIWGNLVSFLLHWKPISKRWCEKLTRPLKE